MILIINKSQKDAMLVSEIFYNMGLLSLAVTPERALSEISNRYRAIIYLYPETKLSIEEYLTTLRRFSLGSPIFAVLNEKDKDSICGEYASLFNRVYYETEISYKLILKIIEYQKEFKKKLIGYYKAVGLDVSVFTRHISYFSIPVEFTKTEIMILRYLVVKYPAPTMASEILKFAFKSSKCPDVSNIRTHISSINKKFIKLVGRPYIASESKVGYTIITPPNRLIKKDTNENKILK